MATPTIPNGEEHFFPIIYEGNGGGQRVGKFVPFTDNGTIDNSCIFNTADNAHLSKTYSGAGTSQQTATISAWVKRGKTGNDFQKIFSVGSDGFTIAFNSGTYSDAIQMYYYTGSYVIRGITKRTFQDTSKWYHIVFILDLSNSTQGDRWRLYVDGDRITEFESGFEIYPSNTTTTTNVGAADTYYVGKAGSTFSYDGYIAELNYVDGQALEPASFGVTDTSTGRWIPSVVKPYPTTTTTFTVTVSNPGSGNVYYIDSSQQATVTLIEGATYRFDQSDSSNSGHPLRFSTTSDGTHGGGSEYTTGVTTVGTPGSAGAYTEITVATGAPTLYYYCTNHSGMGGTANTQDQYGTNGFRMKFQDSSALGDDTSGNGNDFTPTNLASTDQTTDSPTQNFPTFSINGPYIGSQQSAQEGNLKIVMSVGSGYPTVRTLKEIPQSGKWYWEVKAEQVGNIVGIQNATYGVLDLNIKDVNGLDVSKPFTRQIGGMGLEMYGGAVFTGLLTSAGKVATDFTIGSTSMGDDDYIVFAFDMDNGKAWWGWNDSSAGSSVVWFANDGGTDGDPAAGTNPTVTFKPSNHRFVPAQGGFAPGSGYSANFIYNFGSKDFAFTAPTGFNSLSQNNFPETAKGITGLVWIKDRDNALNWNSYDSSNGIFNRLVLNNTESILATQGGVTRFLKGGVAVGDTGNVNNSGATLVSHHWVANSGTTSTNTDGSVTSTVQVNSDAGFSIVQWTGGGSAATVGHGLSQTPEWIFYKRTSASGDGWITYHTGQNASPASGSMQLQSSGAFNTDSSLWNNTAPTSSVISIGSYGMGSGEERTAWVWHSVEGYSKFGKYTGNGDADGPFIYTGFKPAWLMIKSTGSANWYIIDTKRDPINPTGQHNLLADSSSAESSNAGLASLDILSNGFKNRQGAGTGINNSGQDYIYIAFAEHPFVGDGTSPVTAR